jgi:hypothetical protein
VRLERERGKCMKRDEGKVEREKREAFEKTRDER